MGMMDGFSLADVMALKDEDSNSGTWIWIFFLFFLLAWGGGGLFGNAGANNAAVQGALTRADLFEGFNTNSMNNHINDLQMGQFQGFNSLLGAINQSRFDDAKCCCETNRNIDAIRYENAQNTCDIINAGHSDAQRIIDVFTANELQKVRDELQAAKLELNNMTQTAQIVSVLRPYPEPAYLTYSPYEAIPLPTKAR